MTAGLAVLALLAMNAAAFEVPCLGNIIMNVSQNGSLTFMVHNATGDHIIGKGNIDVSGLNASLKMQYLKIISAQPGVAFGATTPVKVRIRSTFDHVVMASVNGVFGQMLPGDDNLITASISSGGVARTITLTQGDKPWGTMNIPDDYQDYHVFYP